MNFLIILNDPPYGMERSYNGLRLAKALCTEDSSVTFFLLADSVACAKQRAVRYRTEMIGLNKNV